MRIIKIGSVIALSLLVSPSLLANKQVHEHKSIIVPEGKLMPKVSLEVFRDVKDGLNLHINTQNYRLNSPNDKRPLDPKLLQGHAHLFINGIKKQRVYGSYLHLPKSWFKQGINQIAVSLNSHKHENWVTDNQTIVSSLFVDLEKETLVQHHFSSQPSAPGHHHH